MNQTDEHAPEAGASPAPGRRQSLAGDLSLGMWGFYFLAKLALYWKELIGFHALANLAFAAFILLPVRPVLWRRIKQAAAVPLGVALLYYDSWLPPIGRVLSQASLVSSFSSTYLIELAERFVSLPVIATLLAGCGAYWLASRWIRPDAAVIAVMAATPAVGFYQDLPPRAADSAPQFAQFETDETGAPALPPVPTQATLPHQLAQLSPTAPPAPAVQQAQPPQAAPAKNDDPNPDLGKVLDDFLAQETGRSVSFAAAKAGAVPFDVIFLHVCSLSWDDLRAADLEHHPLWQRFDIVLTRFNTASSYSGPAAIRMLRATCGQPSHASLYSPAADGCYLMNGLKRSGFEPSLAMNHDGHFDRFLQTVQAQSLSTPLFPHNGAAISQYAFDGSPIYDDLSLLNRWLGNRQKSAASSVALFYNTASLHDGNHLTGEHAKLNSRDNYRIRLEKLLDDLEAFFQSVEKSGRRAVVAMVPEHGAALRGDRMQIAGLREIPSPSITLVPVGVKVIGPDAKRAGRQLKIEKPTSYLAVSHIVARMLEKPPFANKDFSPSDYARDVPVTPFVSQNEELVMIGHGNRYYLRQDADEWIDYTDF